jgi:23S rRNA (cytosine1962-C5)-methyltransferase
MNIITNNPPPPYYTAMVTITLKPGREKVVTQFHPWIYSGAIKKVDGVTKTGDPCLVRSHDGRFLGHGYYNRKSSIAVRMMTFDETPFSDLILTERIREAAALRAAVIPHNTTAYRIINAEGDRLPGLIVDRFGDVLCMQISAACMEGYRQIIAAELMSLFNATAVYERSKGEGRQLEGLNDVEGPVIGSLPQDIFAAEHGLKISIDVSKGQKTGYFTDQRDNRALFASYAQGKRIFDCFCYTGGFALHACNAGAETAFLVDTSAPALAIAQSNLRVNGFDLPADHFIQADAFEFFRHMSHSFDLIVVDPPKLAPHKRDVDAAARAYKDLNFWAIRKIKLGGILFTFSCSQNIDRPLFSQIVMAAAVDSGKSVQILHVLSAAPDHPVSVFHREGDYLKGFVLRVQ